MTEKEEVVGYYTEDGNIYCIACINKNIEIMKEIDRAITSDDLEENPYVCNGCKGKIK
jgi:hypothetical protein